MGTRKRKPPEYYGMRKGDNKEEDNQEGIDIEEDNNEENSTGNISSTEHDMVEAVGLGNDRIYNEENSTVLNPSTEHNIVEIVELGNDANIRDSMEDNVSDSRTRVSNNHGTIIDLTQDEDRVELEFQSNVTTI